MTTALKDKNIYTERMRTIMSQKTWFVDKLPEGINTILDIGGGNGDLGAYIEHNFDRKFNYNVHENTGVFLKGYEKNYPNGIADGNYWYDSDKAPLSVFIDMITSFDPESTVVVFSSVCHEIFHYIGRDYFEIMLKLLKYEGYEYLVFRDMSLFIPKHAPTFSSKGNLRRMMDTRLFMDYEERNIDNDDASVFDFLMKYDYKENWDRESVEMYFHPWVETLAEYYPNIDIYRYSIPYQMNKIYEDWGIELNVLTHANVKTF